MGVAAFGGVSPREVPVSCRSICTAVECCTLFGGHREAEYNAPSCVVLEVIGDAVNRLEIPLPWARLVLIHEGAFKQYLLRI